MLFSPSTHCFYDSRIHPVVPSDVVEISDDRFRELLAAREQNKKIVPDDNGHPVAIESALGQPGKS